MFIDQPTRLALKIWLLLLVIILPLSMILEHFGYSGLATHIGFLALLLYSVVYIWIQSEETVRKMIKFIPFFLVAAVLCLFAGRWQLLEKVEDELTRKMVGVYMPLLCIAICITFTLKYIKVKKPKDQQKE